MSLLACTHETLDPSAQVSTVWHIRTVPNSEKRVGYHPTRKPLSLVRRALVASTHEGGLVFDPFCGSGTTAVKELGCFFVGAELEREFCELAAHKGCCTREPLARDLRAAE